jgi:hypothetical protein
MEKLPEDMRMNLCFTIITLFSKSVIIMRSAPGAEGGRNAFSRIRH